MKTRANFVGKIAMISLFAVMSVSALTSCHKDKDNDNNNNATMYTVSGNANGSQAVPSVTGNGTGTISGTFNSNTRVLTYTSTWTNLTGAPTSGGFYNGATGVNGTSTGSFTFGSNLTGTGSVSGTMTLTADQATQLINGAWYYAINTATNTSGEVRGQISVTAQ